MKHSVILLLLCVAIGCERDKTKLPKLRAEVVTACKQAQQADHTEWQLSMNLADTGDATGKPLSKSPPITSLDTAETEAALLKATAIHADMEARCKVAKNNLVQFMTHE
jgi:hypothetical protein